MCLAVPGKVVEIEEAEGIFRQGKVAFGGMHKTINLAFVPEAEAGAYVLAHAGVAIAVIDEAQARRLLQELASLLVELES